MEKKSDFHFRYPSNLHQLDLATLVSMYRDRGMPRNAKAGDYFGCALTHELIKEGKWWFGLYYSQKAWDKLLTQGSEGYPLTEVELNVLGMVFSSENDAVLRSTIEQNCGVVSKLAYMIVNDLKEFGFLNVEESNRVMITPRGEKALQGLARRIYDRKFSTEMLLAKQDTPQPTMERARKKEDNEQASLF